MPEHIVENCKIIKETEKAILVESEDFDEPEWIPQSQVHEDSEIWKEGQEGDLVVTEWIAEQKGWI